MEQLKEDVNKIKNDVSYLKKMIEDMTLSMSNKETAKGILNDQMETLRNIFQNLPGLTPQAKEQLDKLLDQTRNIV